LVENLDFQFVLGCIQDNDCDTNNKFCNVHHICEDKLCPSPAEALGSSKMKFNHGIQKVGTTAQMICSEGFVYNLGKTEYHHGIPIKQVNLHCTVGPDGKARYVDDFGNAPLLGCSTGKSYKLKPIIVRN
jgi:hypothetical protein